MLAARMSESAGTGAAPRLVAAGAVVALAAVALWRARRAKVARGGVLDAARLPANGSFANEPLRKELDAEDLEFLREWRGGSRSAGDDAALKEHVLTVWAGVKARLHTYRCVQQLSFLHARGRRSRFWPQIVAAGKRGRVVEIGCAFGQDARALLLDGVPGRNLVVSDLVDGYWRAGIEVFGPPGSGALAREFAQVQTLFCDWGAQEASPPESLAGLEGVLCLAVLHVMSKAQSTALLARVGRALRAGGLLVGTCVGALESEGTWAVTPDGTAPRWLYTAASLRQALVAAGLSVDTVVELVEEEGQEQRRRGDYSGCLLRFAARRA